MRRKDKEITNRTQLDTIIRGSMVCRIALAKDNSPYLVPLSFGYDGRKIYLHTAKEGKKLEYFAANPKVCFEFEGNVKLQRNNKSACKWTLEYKSVIGYGTIKEIVEPEQKKYALQQIILQYAESASAIPETAVNEVRVWEIEIKSMTGKKSRKE
ncbi:MAG: pyridoxamine 5'-phosphate oxidase family protein [bacterium]|nr:pyridoxamine 5'-phosphate oxidase family protein [bacterium]